MTNIINASRTKSTKKLVIITGAALLLLDEGAPAVFYYRSRFRQTAEVRRILKKGPGYAVFETRHCIYNIHTDIPAEDKGLTA